VANTKALETAAPMRRALLVVLVVVLALLAYLFLWPSPLEPKAWEPPRDVPMTGAFALNDRLAPVEWWAKDLIGPEAITIDSKGRLVTGLLDGRVVRLEVGSDKIEVLADTKGRPLALAYHPDGRLIICDAHKGLLALDANGKLETLATEEGGVRFAFTDDLDIDADGVIYFSDASARFSVEHFTEDLLEHQTTGRLLKYEPATKKVTRIADGFSFANGVALGPDAQWVVVAEMGAYRLWKIWIKGEQAGKKELFVELPGFPDNVRYSKSRHVFWIAIGSPRNPLVDGLAGWPMLRKVISRLPKAVQPAPERHGFVVAVDDSGKPVESLQHRAPNSYSPIATAVEHDGWLYLGSFIREGVARVRLP
jgi:sugar lactone lactonase YvrE